MELSTCTYYLEKKYGTDRMFEILSKAGFTAVDYNIDDYIGTVDELKKAVCFQSDEIIKEHFSNVKKLAEKHNMKIYQTHAMFGSFQLVSSPEYLQVIKGSILATRILGANYIVIHPIYIPGRIGDMLEQESFECNASFFSKITPTLKKYHVKNGLEPLWINDEQNKARATVCSRPENIMKLIEILGEENYCSCLDFGHIHLTGPETGDTVAGAIYKLGSKMEIVHIHETSNDCDNHTCPFSFDDWNWIEILKAMKDTQSTHSFNFEVGKNYYQLFSDDEVQYAANKLGNIGILMKSIVDGNL